MAENHSLIKNWSTDTTDFLSRIKTISFFDNFDASYLDASIRISALISN